MKLFPYKIIDYLPFLAVIVFVECRLRIESSFFGSFKGFFVDKIMCNGIEGKTLGFVHFL